MNLVSIAYKEFHMCAYDIQNSLYRIIMLYRIFLYHYQDIDILPSPILHFSYHKNTDTLIVPEFEHIVKME